MNLQERVNIFEVPGIDFAGGDIFTIPNVNTIEDARKLAKAHLVKHGDHAFWGSDSKNMWIKRITSQSDNRLI